ncbi:MAG TPA: DUF4266 domain-containing protein [Gammaproteobacteria bacterium]|nr:DUF4266 domain-containing protein [Gammaproteobacteria bacterium]
MKTLIIVISAVAALAASGCSEIKPWQRNILAQPEMQMDPDPMDTYADEHVYFSKEAATGGRGIGGGGCGCN